MTLPGFGRFSEPALLVLISLLDGPKHGYAVADDIERLTGRRPGPGTLYGAISRLEERGFIVARPGDGRRRPYEVTSTGLTETRRELDELRTVAAEGERRFRVATS
jgi:DNA-binding PadR family transcriptional regulator